MLTNQELGMYNHRDVSTDHPTDLPLGSLPPPAYKAAFVGPPGYEAPNGGPSVPSAQYAPGHSEPPPDYNAGPASNSTGPYELGVASSPSAVPATPALAHVSSG